MPDDSLQLYPLWPTLRADMLLGLVYPEAPIPHYVSLGQLSGYLGSGGNASITVSDTEPAGGAAGQMWFDSSIGQLFVYYVDPDSAQWVQANHGGGAGLRIASRTASAALVAGDSGSRIDNAGSVADITLGLPVASRSLVFGFAVMAPHAVTIRPAGGDAIALGTTAGTAIHSARPYSYLQLAAHGTGMWLTSAMVGAWELDP